MSDIFISYKREEQHKAKLLAAALKKQGWTIWWDHELRGGERFDDVIQQALDDTGCVISLLSPLALQSDYVMDETRYAQRRNKLIPVVTDLVELPFYLEGIHTPRLIGWEGDESCDDYQALLDDIVAILGDPPTPQGIVGSYWTEERIEADPEQRKNGASREVEKSTDAEINKPLKHMQLKLMLAAAAVAIIVWLILPLTKNNDQSQTTAGQNQKDKKVWQQEARITKLLERGRAAEDARRLTTPANDNAVDYYREVLELEPENSEAKDGLQRVVQRYLDWAQQALSAGQLDKAELNISKADLADPAHPGIHQLREAVKQAVDTGEMILVNKGCFEMGSPRSEVGRDKDEKQHNVCIEHDFRLGKNEVTVAQFRRFVQDTGYRTDAEKNTGGLEGCWSYDSDGDNKEMYIKRLSWRKPNMLQQNSDEHPVSCVSWHDAIAYIDWLNKKYQATYRLATEAEWEYAARSKSKLARYWGSDVTGDACDYANVADKVSGLEYGFPCYDGYRWVSPVGSNNHKANAWGLHDMLGNVHEWTCSLYDEDYQGSETVCADPEDRGRRVLRGGSWGSKPRNLRLAHRSKNEPYARYYTLGFRLVQEIKKDKP